MSVRELVVLGTSSQVPTRRRSHNACFLRWDDEGLLLDPGEGTQRQFIFADVAPTAVTRILITHFHGDHCLGLASMLQRLSLDGVAHTVHVYYPASGQVYFERLRHASIYHDRLAVEPHPITDEGVIDKLPAFRIEARRLDHPVPTFGYRLEEPERRRFRKDALRALGIAGPAVGALAARGTIEHGGREVRLDEVSERQRGAAFAFVMDTKPCEGARRLAQGADLLVCEATFLDRDADKAERFGHMTVGQAAGLARDADAGRLVLTHFSQRYQDLEPFRDAARALVPDAVIAEDLTRIPVPRPAPAGDAPTA